MRAARAAVAAATSEAGAALAAAHADGGHPLVGPSAAVRHAAMPLIDGGRPMQNALQDRHPLQGLGRDCLASLGTIALICCRVAGAAAMWVTGWQCWRKRIVGVTKAWRHPYSACGACCCGSPAKQQSLAGTCSRRYDMV